MVGFQISTVFKFKEILEKKSQLSQFFEEMCFNNLCSHLQAFTNEQIGDDFIVLRILCEF